jgi:hypothetical protein
MFAESIDVGMRQFIYSNQMKQIEEEVLPFGFNDDGREELNKVHVDNTGQIWREFRWPDEQEK